MIPDTQIAESRAAAKDPRPYWVLPMCTIPEAAQYVGVPNRIRTGVTAVKGQIAHSEINNLRRVADIFAAEPKKNHANVATQHENIFLNICK